MSGFSTAPRSGMLTVSLPDFAGKAKVATHLPPSLSTTRTLPSHPPSAIHLPPGAHCAQRIPNPGSSVDDEGEKEGDVVVKACNSGPSGE